MRYLVDTDICIYAARKKVPAVLARFESLHAGEAGMSVVTHLELTYGAFKSQHVKSNLDLLQELVVVIPVVPLESSVGQHYGRLRAGLERRGNSIGSFDLLIAAHAVSLDLALITNNEREFSRVPGLRIENWM